MLSGDVRCWRERVPYGETISLQINNSLKPPENLTNNSYPILDGSTQMYD